MEERKHHITDIIFVLSLFCVFTVMALFVVILGVNVYKGISGSMDENYNTRTSIAYLTEKVRQNDVEGGIDIRALGGSDALVLTQSVDGAAYETWIYTYDGALREVMVQQGVQVLPGNGQAIMEIEDMRVSEPGGGLLEIVVTDVDGNSANSLVHAVSVEGQVG